MAAARGLLKTWAVSAGDYYNMSASTLDKQGTTRAEYQHVNNLWQDEVAAGLSPLERLVYRSQLLGSDQRITNTGGGNTSSKLTEIDPLTGEAVEVLWVKGS